MSEWAGPVLDNHLHLDPDRGRGLEAVEDFVRAGGTHLIVLNRPSWQHSGTVETPGDFRRGFDRTLSVVHEATEMLPGRAWAMLGVHPALISRLVEDEGMAPEAAAELMRAGLDVALEYVDGSTVLGLKSGRPHYPVADAVWEHSNAVLRHAFELAADRPCPVQLHTEPSEDLSELTEWANDVGLARERVVKHYAGGTLRGPVPSVMSNREDLLSAAETGSPFLMETDFLDDPDRPGAVLGPKTVPRRVDWLCEEGHRDAVRNAHVETPELVYGLDLPATLE